MSKLANFMKITKLEITILIDLVAVIVCGLTTHAEAGMYVFVIVSSSVHVPYYTIK